MKDTLTASVDVAINNLISDLSTLSMSQPVDLAKPLFAREQFPLDELIRTNKSILDAISSLDSSSSMMTKYLDQTPLPQIVENTLKYHMQE